ncbi:MAG: MBL fold metallo-hydrolase [Agathobacter sp.]|nr:MBL fold metallo-hydrolase [Agathobacter sp.]
MKQDKTRILSAFLCCFILLLSACGTVNNSSGTEQSANSTVAEQEVSFESSSDSNKFDEVSENSEDNSQVSSGSDNSSLKVHYIDVGQGDSSFVELPNGETILIDAGIPSQGYVVTNYIKNLGYTDIDYVVATHPHNDHIGGLPTVLESFKVGKFYMPNKEHTSDIFMTMLTAVQSNGCKAAYAKSGLSVIDEGNLKVNFVAPVSSGYSDLNNYSAVLRISYDKSSFLFTGDAEDIVEAELISSGQTISADVLKVGHHGSGYSSTASFLKVVKPKYAIISVGRNSYGHPTAEALTRLVDVNAQIYRTDEVGTVVVTTDGKAYTLDKNASTIQNNAPPVVVETTPAPVQEETVVEEAPVTQTDVAVYVTKTGSKYHRYGCSYLKSCIETTLSSAKRSGYGACSRCNPPR